MSFFLAGYYCVLGAQTPTPSLSVRGGPCEQGTFCEAGASSPTPCPIGTYGPRALLPSEADCTACDPGRYCSGTSLTEDSGPCMAGFYCTGSAESSNPTGVPYGDVCPVGHYCPEESPFPMPCAAGYYQPLTQRTALSDCILCTPGKYCTNPGSSNYVDDCDAGYYCTGGAITASPTDGTTGNICPEGSYCPLGSPMHMFCPNGTYTNHTGASACYDCPAGYYCSERVDALPCPAGYYCPTNTGIYAR